MHLYPARADTALHMQLRSTPLHLAALCNQLESVRLLIGANADVGAKDKVHLTRRGVEGGA